MKKLRIIGLIAAMNPEIPLLKRTVASCRGQVDSVILSDCSTKPEIIEQLQQLERESDGFLTVIWNSEDPGGGRMYNQAARLAIQRGVDWVITLTDDSPLKPTLVQTMLDAYSALTPEQQKSVGIITPNLLSIRGFGYPDGEPRITEYGGTTEGQMVKPIVYATAGFYNEDFYMDCIDGEFCHRANAAGFKNLAVPRAVAEARWGIPDMRKFFGKTILIPNYAPYRYYYNSRNLLYLYTRKFKLFILQNHERHNVIWALIVPRYFIKMLLFEKNKKVKIRACLRGWWDGIRGRLGPMPKDMLSWIRPGAR